jgi:hypothetical protein
MYGSSNIKRSIRYECQRICRLAEGEQAAGDLVTEAKQVGISKSALYRARKKLNIQTRKDGKKGWLWKQRDLPIDFDKAGEDSEEFIPEK